MSIENQQLPILLTYAQFARETGISKSQLGVMIRKGIVPVVRISPRCTRIARATLEALAAGKEVR